MEEDAWQILLSFLSFFFHPASILSALPASKTEEWSDVLLFDSWQAEVGEYPLLFVLWLDVLHGADIYKAENACIDFSLGMNVNRKLS